MRRFVLVTGAVIGFLYLALIMVLSSGPVQKRVLEEIQVALRQFDLQLEMESIEFSGISATIYLNRVRLSTGRKAPVRLEASLPIDKIKIKFSPLLLLYRQIAISELVLIHPKIFIPRADEFYERLNKWISSRSMVKMQGGKFSVLLKKVGVVDALINLSAQNPKMAFRSQSFTGFVETDLSRQQSITIQSNHIELERGNLELILTQLDLDADVTEVSIRLNRATFGGKDYSLSIVGAADIAKSGWSELPETFSVNYELNLPLPFIAKMAGLNREQYRGQIISKGTIQRQQGKKAFSWLEQLGSLTGKGTLEYQNVSFKEYQVGSGKTGFLFLQDKLELQNPELIYAGGEFRGKTIELTLAEPFPIMGNLEFKNLLLEKILESVRVQNSPVSMRSSGTIAVSGSLKPLEIRADLKSEAQNFTVLKDGKQPVSHENTVIHFASGTLQGPLVFKQDKMEFEAAIGALEGNLEATGFIGFDDSASVNVKGQDISLTSLDNIAGLKLRGVAKKLGAQIRVDQEDVDIGGHFQVSQGEVADLVLGDLSANTHYQNELLSFEDMEMVAMEPIRANGYLDFRGKGTAYKFYIDGKRVQVEQVFSVFQKSKLNFKLPTGGEVAARVTVEGTGEKESTHVTATGQAKGMQWLGESWLTANFSGAYSDGGFVLNRVLLAKRNGALEIKGSLYPKDSHLVMESYGLRLEEIEQLGQAPIAGVIVGSLTADGTQDVLFQRLKGDLKLVKSSFRGEPLLDISARFFPVENGTQFDLSTVGDQFRASGMVPVEGKSGELKGTINNFNLAPYLAAYFKKDLSPLDVCIASGQASIKGMNWQLHDLRGQMSVSKLDVGNRKSPLILKKPFLVQFNEEGIESERFSIANEEGEVYGLISFKKKAIASSFDANLNLNLLQPFIPGLESASGRVSVGLRVSGKESKPTLLGNVILKDGTIRLQGFLDDFSSVEAALSLSQERINVDKFVANINGGTAQVLGHIKLGEGWGWAPNLSVSADRVSLRATEYLAGKLSGDFTLKGDKKPYLFAGRCLVHEGLLTQLKSDQSLTSSSDVPIFNFDISCVAKENFQVKASVIDSEFKGNLQVLGNVHQIGLLGSGEAVAGTVLFKDTRFAIDSANVRFESPTSISPRFNVSANALVKDQNTLPVQEYEVRLNALGTPSDYRIRLTSTPPLSEPDIISLLVLGITNRTARSGSVGELASTIAGQLPIGSKLQDEFGLDVRLGGATPGQSFQNATSTATPDPNSSSGASSLGSSTSPAQVVTIRKQLSKKTRLSYSNTIETNPRSEFRLEQMLDDHFTVNATIQRSDAGVQNQPTQGYGLDFSYRFQFD